MTRDRKLLSIAIAAALVAGTAGLAWSLWGDTGTYGHSLEKFSEKTGEKNRYLTLDDRSQFSIGSPDSHDIVVQWRDPDGHGWTEPETVWNDPKYVAVDNTVRHGGNTVAIRQEYSADTGDEYADHVTIGIVCRDRHCDTYEKPGWPNEILVTPNGRTALIGQDDKALYLWRTGNGIKRLPWPEGSPLLTNPRRHSNPVLAPDGSMVVISRKRHSLDRCVYELLTSRPRSTVLRTVARADVHFPDRRPVGCAPGITAVDKGWVEVDTQSPRFLKFWFVRDGKTWRISYRDQSGLRLNRPAEGDPGYQEPCRYTQISQFDNQANLAWVSLDGLTIQIQTRGHGATQWTDPVVLDGAPRGARCVQSNGLKVGTGFALLLSFRTPGSGPYRRELDGDAVAVVASADLKHWDTMFISGLTPSQGEPDSFFQVEDDRLQIDDVTWSAETGFEKH